MNINNLQGIVEEQLVGSGNLRKAWIIDKSGDALTGFQATLNTGEGYAISKLFNDLDEVFINGLTVRGVQYECSNADDKQIHCKKDKTGIICSKANSCIVIGYYDERMVPDNAVETVKKVTDSLIQNGY